MILYIFAINFQNSPRMKYFSLLFFFLLFFVSANADTGYPITPVPFTDVKVEDSFWQSRIEKNRLATIPIALNQCEITGRFEHFTQAANPNDTVRPRGILYDDSDVYKIIEGIAYSLQSFPDKKLEKTADSIISLIENAQEPDGYLYTFRTMNPHHHNNKGMGSRRWERVEHGSHELYNQGHMIEAAVAYYMATGKRTLLDVAIRSADCICRSIGTGEGQERVVPGHEEIELALCKLYLVTGDKKYLNQVQFFIDQRGRTERRSEYSQSHKPVTEQTEACGHAVRAGYLYCGIADLAALTGNRQYIQTIDTIWQDIVRHRLYLTGGIGSAGDKEAFGPHYFLPNETAYNETCAAIAWAFLNQRLFLLHGESKYIDMLERTLYNGMLSGLALDGKHFFYPNPLASRGGYGRKEWFGTACCPSNLCRFIPSLPGYVYAVHKKKLYVNLFMSNSTTLDIEGRKLSLSQKTDYPWDGHISLTINSKRPGQFDLALRIPGWVRNEVVPGGLYSYADGLKPQFQITVNGQVAEGSMSKGYFIISRTWKHNDKVDISFDMPARTVTAYQEVEANRGRTAFERGPLVYCAEESDNPTGIFNKMLPKKPLPEVGVFDTTKLQGICPILVPSQQVDYTTEGYITTKISHLHLIPYYAWANRKAGQMNVWFPQNLKGVEPSYQ